MKNLFLLLATGILLAACSDSALQTTNPKKVPYTPPAEAEKVSDIGEISKESFRPALDILFVIDNSYSMDIHQQRLADNITLFTDAITKAKFLDYHIGVINSSSYSYGGSSTCCGVLSGNPNYVDRNTPNGISKLAQNLIVGTGGDATEMFLGPIQWAFEPKNINGKNAGFLRTEAYLAIIIITDTEDQTGNGVDAQSTLDYLKLLKGSTDKLFVGGVYIEDKDVNSCSGESSEIIEYDELHKFFQLTNAMTFSLCDPDYGTKLAEIGKLLANKAQTLYLKKIPKAGTLSITIGGIPLPNDAKKGWTFNPMSNGLEFGREIDWSIYPDNTYPVVNFESLPVSHEGTKYNE